MSSNGRNIIREQSQAMVIRNKTILRRLFEDCALARFAAQTLTAQRPSPFITDHIGALQWLDIKGWIVLEPFLIESDQLDLITGSDSEGFSVRITPVTLFHPGHYRAFNFYHRGHCGLFLVQPAHEAPLARFLIPQPRTIGEPGRAEGYMGHARFLIPTQCHDPRGSERRMPPLTAIG